MSNYPLVEVSFYSIRNVSSPEDSENSRTVYTGQVPITSVVKLPTDENVRDYLVEAEGKKRKATTQVHRAIAETLLEHPDNFSVLNSGIVIVARSVEVDDKQKVLKLVKPSIINGSQTQGVIEDYLEGRSPLMPIHVKFELIICDDDDLIADISIARNFQNDVAALSIAGRKGYLDELEEKVQKFLGKRLQKSESQRPAENNNVYPTEKLLQVIAALLPRDLWWKDGEPSKVYTYSAKATCLKDFQTIYQNAKEEKSKGKEGDFSKVYAFYLDIAPHAVKIYEKWKQHQSFKGTGLRSIERDEKQVVEVPDGIVFPILAALSEFAVKRGGEWTIEPPKELDDSELIQVAKRAYMEIAKSKPEIMGKTKACYSALEQITSIYKRLLQLA